MPRSINTVLLLSCSLALAACGSDSAGDPSAAPAEDKETVFDPMVDTIDRAKEVEDLVDQRKKEMDEKLKELEGT